MNAPFCGIHRLRSGGFSGNRRRLSAAVVVAQAGNAHIPLDYGSLPDRRRAPRWRGSLLQWRSDERKTFYLCSLVLGACAFVSLIYVQEIWGSYAARSSGHPPPFGDFFALWSYAKIATAHPAAELYDLAALHARQVALGMDAAALNPFPYPPVFILLLCPLGFLPYEIAYLVWSLGTLALFVWAAAATCSRLPLCLLGLIVAPASTAAIASGQSGFLAAALITAGIRLAGSRPVLGGMLMGLLSYKPQLCVLLPIALVAAGFWAALCAACATAIGLSVGATLCFGWTVWPAWLSMLGIYSGMFDRASLLLKLEPTVTAGLQMFGFSPAAARCAQAFAALAVAIPVWRCFRRSPDRLATAALLVGTFLATPHAFVYDLPMVSAALALFIDERTTAGSQFGLAEVTILTTAFTFPALMMMAGVNVPVNTVSLALFFAAILWRSHEADRRTPQRGLVQHVAPPVRTDPSAPAAAQNGTAGGPELLVRNSG